MEEEILSQLAIFKENSLDLISPEGLKEKITNSLTNKKPLRLKIGLDPTSRDIHLGHTVLLRKLRKLQDLGHQVCLIIGDFTAKIGDPSGRNSLRPILSDEEIRNNASTYTQQAFTILDQNKTTIIYNSQWYKDMKLSDFLGILSSYTVAQVLQREDFAQRLEENKPLSLLEIIYPLIQGYDSVMLKADVEFGGNDQKFNLLVGRCLQTVFNQPGQEIVTMPLLVGLDGSQKMSKSLGNYIGVTEIPKDMFGKIMSISDELMWEYFRLLTDHKVSDMQKLHPKEAKILLAKTIVEFFHSKDKANQEEEAFRRVFSQKEIPQDIETYKVTTNQVDIIEVLTKAGIVDSKNEARRLLNQAAISIINSKDSSQTNTLDKAIIDLNSEPVILKIGKKRFIKIILG